MIIQKTRTSNVATPDGGLDWFLRSPEAATQALDVDPAAGLNDAAIQSRQAQYGLNELREAPLRSPLKILWEQLTNPLVLLLLGAALISALLGKTTELIAILAIVVLNAALGVAQEYRAEKAMAALKKMSAPLVRVRRGGRVLDIDPKELVPGDIVLLEAGSIIPADARLIEAANLKVQEASLTGESEPVEKDIEALKDKNAPLGDRRNMVYFGTSVTYGRGVAMVTTTGMGTELGRIAQLIQMVEAEKTPLQRRLAEMGRVLLFVALGVMAVSFVIGLITGQPLDTVLLESVAIAVAVVPEGLPAVITVPPRPGAPSDRRRNARLGDDHLLGQDRHADAEQDDGHAGGRGQQRPHDGRGRGAGCGQTAEHERHGPHQQYRREGPRAGRQRPVHRCDAGRRRRVAQRDWRADRGCAGHGQRPLRYAQAVAG